MAEPGDQFVVPYPPGGSTDVARARDRRSPCRATLGQQIVVENKTGASGNIGIEAAAKSAADGYTVLSRPIPVTSAPHVFKMSIDPLKESGAGHPAVPPAGRAGGASRRSA